MWEQFRIYLRNFRIYLRNLSRNYREDESIAGAIKLSMGLAAILMLVSLAVFSITGNPIAVTLGLVTASVFCLLFLALAVHSLIERYGNRLANQRAEEIQLADINRMQLTPSPSPADEVVETEYFAVQHSDREILISHRHVDVRAVDEVSTNIRNRH